MDTKETTDEETAQALRDAGMAVSAETDAGELYRRVALPAQAQMRRDARAAEKELKSFYCDWVFDSLNLSKYK